MVQPIESLVSFATAAIARVEQDPGTARVGDLARRLTSLVRECGRGRETCLTPLNDLKLWLIDARTCGVRPIEAFAEGLQQDGAAVRAALTTPLSNGQAEGQITRLKLLKRTMYGRTGFDFLRRRVLLGAQSTQNAGEPPTRGKITTREEELKDSARRLTRRRRCARGRNSRHGAITGPRRQRESG